MGKNLWKGDEVVTAINGSGPSNWTASGVSIDTRSLKKGDIFFALSGPNYDGRQFISSAIKKGASVVVSNTPSIELNDKIIIVNDVLSALIALGRASRERNKGKIIAITGSSGKTTVKEMLALSLRKFGKLHYSEASYNNKIGVSLSLARMPSDSDFSIYELGMNHPGEISFLSKLVKPNIALINNVGNAHIGFFDSKKGIENAKLEIIDGVTINGKILFHDQLSISESIKKTLKQKNIEIFYFGDRRDSNFSLKKYQYFLNLSLIDVLIKSLKISFNLNIPGKHMAMNSLAVIGICNELNVDLKIIIKELLKFEPIKGRGNISNYCVMGKGIKVIDESYNANPESIIASINLLSEINFLEFKNKIIILGDMFELGKLSKFFHIKMASVINKSNINSVFCAGSEMLNLWNSLSIDKKGYYSSNPKDIIKPLIKKIKKNDIILIKGSYKSGIKIVLNSLNEENLKRKIV